MKGIPMGKVIQLDRYRKVPPRHFTDAQVLLLALSKYLLSVYEGVEAMAPTEENERREFLIGVYFGSRGVEAFRKCCGSRVFMGERLAREFMTNSVPLGSWGEFGQWIVIDKVPRDPFLIVDVIKHFFANDSFYDSGT